jgi:hypothetical protein
METPQSNFQIPRPTDWQREFLQKEDELQPRLIAICLGRRGGKSFISLLWILLNRLGFLNELYCSENRFVSVCLRRLNSLGASCLGWI